MRYFALIVGKIIAVLLRLMKKTGGSLPGKVAVKYCPNILRYFKYPSKTIIITGTNGKTSTSNIIYNLFDASSYNTISNSRGDNIINGIASLLIKNSDFGFNIKADVLVLEVDELTLAKQIKNIDASDIVITNFFRDQLDRAGEMETIIKKLQVSLENYKGRLYLNEDDPNVKRFAYSCKSADVISFGVSKVDGADDTNMEAKEGKFCCLCSSPLEYEYYQYSHIGKYRCINCDFAHNMPDFAAQNINKSDDSFEILCNKDERVYKLHYSIGATYHLYNLASAGSVGMTYDISVDVMDKVFANFNLGIGRMEKIAVGDRSVLLNLVKNPTGCNEIIKYMEKGDNNKAIIFLLNDNHADGRDTSWIWDVNFEEITKLDTIILTGKRAYEAGTRFKLSRVCDNIVVEKDVDKAIDILVSKNADLYVISTYTGLFDIRKRLMNKSR